MPVHLLLQIRHCVSFLIFWCRISKSNDKHSSTSSFPICLLNCVTYFTEFPAFVTQRRNISRICHKMIKTRGLFLWIQNKIVVLHKGAHLYCCVRAPLYSSIVLLFVMFGPGHTDKKQTSKQYAPGTCIRTSHWNNTNLEVEVSVDSSGSIPSGLPT